MEWAKEIFLYDSGLKTWTDVKKSYGVGVEANLRTFAGVLKKEVKTSDKINKKSRPLTYLDWFKKITSKVYIFFYIKFCINF
jgi:hypothetical protein